MNELDYTFLAPTRECRVVNLSQGYDVPKYKWLRKTLKWLGLLKTSYHQECFDSYKRFTISSPHLRGLIQNFLREIARTTHIRPTKIYIGSYAYERLIQEAHLVHTQIVWPVKIYGIEIVLTPFLDGLEFFPVFD